MLAVKRLAGRLLAGLKYGPLFFFLLARRRIRLAIHSFSSS